MKVDCLNELQMMFEYSQDVINMMLDDDSSKTLKKIEQFLVIQKQLGDQLEKRQQNQDIML